MSKRDQKDLNSMVQSCKKYFETFFKYEDQQSDFKEGSFVRNDSLDNNLFDYLSDNKEVEEKEESNIIAKENDAKASKNEAIKEGAENKKENPPNIAEKRKRGRPRKPKKNEENEREFAKSLCKFCGKRYNKYYIKNHVRNKHPSYINLENAQKYAEKCISLIDHTYNYIYVINFYAKTIYQLLSNIDKEYKKMDWFINFEKCLNKIGKLNLNANNSFQRNIKDPIQLRESEQMKQFKPKEDLL